MTLDQLKVLSVLQETGSVSAAAQRLHRAQSAVSYAIRMLEEDLDLTLVDRSGYRAKLTPGGMVVLARGNEMLALGSELENLAQALRGGAEPELTLLVDGILPIRGLMPLLGPLSQGNGPTRINLRVEMMGGLAHALNHHQPDLALTMSVSTHIPEGYLWEPLGRIVMVPVASSRHPLSLMKTPIPLKALKEHIHLVVTSPPEFQTPVDLGLVGARRRWNFPDFNSRLEGLVAGLGFAWMPTHLVEDGLAAGNLQALVLGEGGVHTSEVGVIFRHHPPLGTTGRHILGQLRRLGTFPSPPSAQLLSRFDLPKV